MCLERNERGGEGGGKGIGGAVDQEVIQDLVGLREDWSFY